MSNKTDLINHNNELSDISNMLSNVQNTANNLPTYLDTSDATATAYDIVSGMTAYVNGEKIIGMLDINAAPINIFLQTNEPMTKEGIWINTSINYYYLQEVDYYNPYGAYNPGDLLITKGFTYNTKIISDLTYYFENIAYIGSSYRPINISDIYYGDGVNWISLGGAPSPSYVLTPEEAIEANSTLDNVLGQPNQGDTDNLTQEEEIEANDIADMILGNK